ncbi:MAG: GntR family transcriptional regulator [Lentisphaerae bacterium]|nr:MAG: GntR family transcriptional regulator [Lentisphaerota bacterium]
MSKCDKIVRILEERIVRGEYLTRIFPAERELAQEMNVSRMTARKAVLTLLEKGLLERLPNGRIRSRPIDAEGKPRRHAAFLLPAGLSPDHQIWEQAILRAAKDYGIGIHPYVYDHPSAMLLQEIVESFDGVFILAETFMGKERYLRDSAKPVFVLGNDLSRFGIVSIQLFPAGCGTILFDYLYRLGHREIAFLCTGEAYDDVLNQRIRDWQNWMAEHPDCSGRLIQRHTEWHTDRAQQSFAAMSELLAAGSHQESALVCGTVWMAMGAIKALRSHHLDVPQDVAVCTFNGEGIGQWFNPSITSLEMADPTPVLKRCMEIICSGGNWTGPLLCSAGEPHLFEGESTQHSGS